jgi:hypothetical protein
VDRYEYITSQLVSFNHRAQFVLCACIMSDTVSSRLGQSGYGKLYYESKGPRYVVIYRCDSSRARCINVG